MKKPMHHLLFTKEEIKHGLRTDMTWQLIEQYNAWLRAKDDHDSQLSAGALLRELSEIDDPLYSF